MNIDRPDHPERGTEPAAEPLPRMMQPGYYPGYETLSQQDYWDAATRRVVLERVNQPPAIRYFQPLQVKFWTVVFNHLLPQDDRTRERRIPIVEQVDDLLFHNRGVGYRYEDMPPNRDAYRLGEQAIEVEAKSQFGNAFLELSYHQRDLTLKTIHDGKPTAAKEIWQQMSVGRFWQMLMQDAIGAYYAHPWAWDEIGYGGPAYPRAYTRLERGEPEPWEVEEQRYAWLAPDDSVSDICESTHHLHSEALQNTPGE